MPCLILDILAAAFLPVICRIALVCIAIIMYMFFDDLNLYWEYHTSVSSVPALYS